MDLLINTKFYKYLFVTLCLFYYSCSMNSNSTLNKEQVYSNVTVDSLFNSKWQYGFHYLHFSSDTIHIAYLLKNGNIKVINDRDSSMFREINNIEGDVLGMYSKDSSLFVLFNNHLKQYSFKVDMTFTERTYYSNLFFNDSNIIYAYIHSNIVPTKNDEILIPYRLDNESVNMIDTFAYYLFKLDKDSLVLKGKMIKQPTSLLNTFEYLKLPLCVYSGKLNSIYFTFQKFPVLYKYDLSSLKLDSVIFKYDTIPFKAKHKEDIGYIRK